MAAFESLDPEVSSMWTNPLAASSPAMQPLPSAGASAGRSVAAVGVPAANANQTSPEMIAASLGMGDYLGANASGDSSSAASATAANSNAPAAAGASGGIPREVLDRVGFTFDHDGGYTYRITPEGYFEIVAAPEDRGVGYELTPSGEYASAWRTLADYIVAMGPVGGAPEQGPPEEREPADGEQPSDGTPWQGGPAPDPGAGGPDAPTQDAPEPGRPGSGAPAGSQLAELMSKPRLTPEEIDQARELIEALPPDQQGDLFLQLQEKVEYSNQRDNESDQEGEFGGTCNLTAVAMALKALGIPNPHPEMQYEDALIMIAGSRDITAYATWEYVANQLGASSQEIGSGVLSKEEWMQIRDQHLAKGHGVVMSLRGHVVRLQGVDDRGLIVDDPYGASTLAAETRRDKDGQEDVYNWTDSNDTTAGGATPGEDLGYPWEDALTYQFGTIFAFTR